MFVALWLQAMHLTAPRSCTKNVLTQLWVRKKGLWTHLTRLIKEEILTRSRGTLVTFLGQRQRDLFKSSLSVSFPFLRFPGGEGQRLLRVRDAVQHDQVQQGAVLRQDPQQGLGEVPGKEVQQIRAVHQVRTDGALTHCFWPLPRLNHNSSP